MTDLLLGSRAGGRELDRLTAALYDELKRVAHAQLRTERPDHTLGTTGLVHESYLRLVDQARTDWSDRSHFLRVAAMTMRRVLVDHARAHRTTKRGSGQRAVSLDAVDLSVDDQVELMLEVDDILTRIFAMDERLGRIVECRWFAGLTEAETAEAVGVNERTVRRDWTKARGLLRMGLSAT